VLKVTSVRSALTQAHMPLVYCPVVDNTLFEVGPEIRSLDVSSRNCYGNHAAGSEPI